MTYQQAELFIIHISTADKLGLFVLMVLQEAGYHLNKASLMEFIVLIGVMQVFKAIDITNTVLK